MKFILIDLSILDRTLFVTAYVSKPEDKPPVTAQNKPQVKKPCKVGQTPEKDKCHVLKKVEKKK